MVDISTLWVSGAWLHHPLAARSATGKSYRGKAF